VKKLWKGMTALVLCVLVLFTAIPRAQGATVYFMAVNDKLLDLKSSTMPVMVRGLLYVPYTMLSASDTGVNLGVYAMYSSVKNQVLVYSNRVQLIFDIQENQTYDLNGHNYDERAILRGSVAYLPISRVCAVFSGDISYSVNSTQYGYLVRVWNSAVVLGDEAFIDAAANMMNNALTRYQQESASAAPASSPASSAAPVTTASPAATATPAPSTSSAPASTPVVVATPSPASPSDDSSGSSGVTDDPGVSGDGAGVYLAFTQTPDGSLDGVLSALESQGTQGLFLLTLDQLTYQGDLVRKILGSGHSIGLSVQAESAQEALSELELGAQALSEAAHSRLGVVMVEGLDDKDLAEVERAGYVCWSTTTDGRSLEGSAVTRAAALIRQLTSGASAKNYLLLDDRSNGTLSGVLSALSRSDFQFRTPLATEL
jgi:hypothetical protein